MQEQVGGLFYKQVCALRQTGGEQDGRDDA
jgi:hypothetical protein